MNAELKRALKQRFSGRILVRMGGTGDRCVYVFLPRSVRLVPENLTTAKTLIEQMIGPRYSIQPSWEA